MDSVNKIISDSGLSQSEFSRKTGIPLRTVQHWVEGTRSPASWVINLLRFWVDKQQEQEG